jgi:rsbT co-antagonist protein RsbR
MWNQLKKIVSPPIFEDEEKTRVAGILHIILLAFIVLVIVRAFVIASNTGEYSSLTIGIPMLLAGVYAGLYVFMRRGYVHLVSILFVLVYWGMTTLAIWGTGGVRGPGYSLYIVVVVVVGLLLGGRWVFGLTLASIIAGFSLYRLESQGLFEVNPYQLSLEAMFYNVTQHIIIAAVLVYIYHRGITQAMNRAHRSAQETAVFRSLAENAADGIFMATTTGEITYANRAGYELLGRDYEQKEIDDLDFATLIPAAEEVEVVSDDTLLATLQAGSWQGELQQQRRDGTIVDVHSTAFAIEDEKTEEAIALAAIIRDITQQKQAEIERGRLQQEVIAAQQQAIKELSTPVIPIMEQVIVMPLVGSIDTLRARDVTRSLLAGISEHQAKVVIVDITGVTVVDTGVVNYLNKTIQAARLKGARTIVTGISDAVAETIVELGIDWSNIETLRDLQTGLTVALGSLGVELNRSIEG